jgi:hypothetical protein
MTGAQLELRPVCIEGAELMPEPLTADVHEITAKLAYQFWEQRGRPLGSPEVDWFAAEKTLASPERLELPLYGITLEANEGASLTNSRSIQNSEA